MKLKIFILGLLALCGISASAAENYFRPGTIWTTRINVEDPNHQDFLVYYTILDEITFEGEKVLPLTSYACFNEEGYEPKQKIERYIRTDGDKVYWRSTQAESSEWYLLYDFGLQVGDVVTVYYLRSTGDHENEGQVIEEVIPHSLECIQYDYYLNDNPLEGPLMKFKSSGSSSKGEGDWIIGMGYLNGSGNLLNSGSYGLEGDSSETLCVESPKGNVVYGSPVTGVKTVSDSSQPEVKAGVFNMQGIRVADSTDNLPAGLYIFDGKKVAISK